MYIYINYIYTREHICIYECVYILLSFYKHSMQMNLYIYIYINALSQSFYSSFRYRNSVWLK